MQDNGTILFDSVTDQTLSGVSGAGRIEIKGGIALTLNGENTFNGETTIDATGSLQIGDPNPPPPDNQLTGVLGETSSITEL
jgi:autotransporter-associated beta strand protein